MGPTDIQGLRDLGLSDAGLHDAAAVVAYFNFVNRIALGLGVELETETAPEAPRPLPASVDDAAAVLEGCAEQFRAAVPAGAAPAQVAILRLLNPDELGFAYPRALARGNRLPVRGSMAGRALTDGRGVIDNAVANAPHFSLYEKVSRETATHPIQAMVAVVLHGPEGPIGVVEVSRIGASSKEAGTFETEDLERVLELATTVGPVLERIWEPPE